MTRVRALFEHPALPVHHAQARVQGSPVGLDPLAHGRAELLEVVEQAFDIRPEEGDDPQLVARVQAAFHLGGVLADPVDQLVQRRERPRLARRLDDGPGQLELRQQVPLDGHRPLCRGAPDVGQGVERIDVLEDDRLQIGGAAVVMHLQTIQDGLAEPPLHHRVDGREALLDLGLDAGVELVQAPLHGHGEERQHFLELGQMGRVEVVRLS